MAHAGCKAAFYILPDQKFRYSDSGESFALLSASGLDVPRNIDQNDLFAPLQQQQTLQQFRTLVV